MMQFKEKVKLVKELKHTKKFNKHCKIKTKLLGVIRLAIQHLYRKNYHWYRSNRIQVDYASNKTNKLPTMTNHKSF